LGIFLYKRRWYKIKTIDYVTVKSYSETRTLLLGLLDMAIGMLLLAAVIYMASAILYII
jgi:hypothetical protein